MSESDGFSIIWLSFLPTLFLQLLHGICTAVCRPLQRHDECFCLYYIIRTTYFYHLYLGPDLKQAHFISYSFCQVAKGPAEGPKHILGTYCWNTKDSKRQPGFNPITLPSVEIQIMGMKVCLRCKGRTLLAVVNKLFVFKKILTSPSNVFALLPQVNFHANNLNFH